MLSAVLGLNYDCYYYGACPIRAVVDFAKKKLCIIKTMSLLLGQVVDLCTKH